MLRPEFGRRFREVTAGQTQEEVAEALGCSQSYVSRMYGGWIPSRKILDRIIERYRRVPEAEWLALASQAEPAGEADEEARLAAVAARAAEEALRRVGVGGPSPAQQLFEGIRELNRKYGCPVPVDFSGGIGEGEHLTAAQVAAILEDLDRQLAEDRS